MQIDQRPTCLVVTPNLGNNFGVLDSSISTIEESLQRYFNIYRCGIEDSRFFEHILSIGAETENIVFWNYFGYDASLSAFNKSTQVPLCSLIKAHQIIIVDDPPYYSWMYNRLVKISCIEYIICTDNSIEAALISLFPEASTPNVLDFYPKVPQEYSIPKSYKSREVDIVIACTIQSKFEWAEVEEAFRRLPSVGSLLFDYLKRLSEEVENHKFNTFNHTQTFFCLLYGDDIQAQKVIRENRFIIYLIEVFDRTFRYTSRISIVDNFLNQIRDQKIIIVGNIHNHLAQSRKLDTIDSLTIEKLSALVATARFSLDVAVPGSNNLHYRAKLAIALGTGLITTNTTICQTPYQKLCWTPTQFFELIDQREIEEAWYDVILEGSTYYKGMLESSTSKINNFTCSIAGGLHHT